MAENNNPEAASAKKTADADQPGETKQAAQAAGQDQAQVEHDHELSEMDTQAPADSEPAAGDDQPEVATLRDQVLRAMAEMENIKRRAARDVEQAHKFAVEKLIGDLFPVIDSLEKAVETAATVEGAEPIAEGVELSLKLFVDTLAKSGVEQIDPLGEPFDPQVHEAMTMVPNPDAEPNSVMDVMQKGYVLNGRLVRAAKVIVVKGDD